MTYMPRCLQAKCFSQALVAKVVQMRPLKIKQKQYKYFVYKTTANITELNCYSTAYPFEVFEVTQLNYVLSCVPVKKGV